MDVVINAPALPCGLNCVSSLYFMHNMLWQRSILARYHKTLLRSKAFFKIAGDHKIHQHEPDKVGSMVLLEDHSLQLSTTCP